MMAQGISRLQCIEIPTMLKSDCIHKKIMYEKLYHKGGFPP